MEGRPAPACLFFFILLSLECFPGNGEGEDLGKRLCTWTAELTRVWPEARAYTRETTRAGWRCWCSFLPGRTRGGAAAGKERKGRREQGSRPAGRTGCSFRFSRPRAIDSFRFFGNDGGREMGGMGGGAHFHTPLLAARGGPRSCRF